MLLHPSSWRGGDAPLSFDSLESFFDIRKTPARFTTGLAKIVTFGTAYRKFQEWLPKSTLYEHFFSRYYGDVPTWNTQFPLFDLTHNGMGRRLHFILKEIDKRLAEDVDVPWWCYFAHHLSYDYWEYSDHGNLHLTVYINTLFHSSSESTWYTDFPSTGYTIDLSEILFQGSELTPHHISELTDTSLKQLIDEELYPQVKAWMTLERHAPGLLDTANFADETKIARAFKPYLSVVSDYISTLLSTDCGIIYSLEQVHLSESEASLLGDRSATVFQRRDFPIIPGTERAFQHSQAQSILLQPNDTDTMRHEFTIDFFSPSYTYRRWTIREDNERYGTLLSYSTNVLNYLPNKLTAKDEPNNTPLFGVELELTTDYNVCDIVNATSQNFCVCKSDSSITGSKSVAYEVVTAPASLRMHKRSWLEMFKKLGLEMFDTSRNTNNGMHVHLDINAFLNHKGELNYTHYQHFVWWFYNPANQIFNLTVGERQLDKIQYCSLPTAISNTSRTPQNPLYYFNSALSYLEEGARYVVAKKGNYNDDGIIPKTLEVRLFKGIVSPAAIWKNLEYVQAIYNFTSQCCFLKNSLDNFLDWLYNQPKNQYRYLRKFLDTLNLEEYKREAVVRNMLWRSRYKFAESIADYKNLYASDAPYLQRMVDEMKYLNLFRGDPPNFEWDPAGHFTAFGRNNRSRIHMYDDELMALLQHKKIHRTQKGSSKACA